MCTIINKFVDILKDNKEAMKLHCLINKEHKTTLAKELVFNLTGIDVDLTDGEFIVDKKSIALIKGNKIVVLLHLKESHYSELTIHFLDSSYAIHNGGVEGRLEWLIDVIFNTEINFQY